MDRLESMSILIEVAHAGSLSGAGRKLGIPLATVSRKISDLETHLKTRLLTRTTRRIALTDAGSAYVAACARILEQVEEAERAATGEYGAAKGLLTISAPIVFGRLHILPVVTEFLAAYHEINIGLKLGDGILDLVDEHVDVALRIGSLPDSGLIARNVGSIRRVLCASPAYLEKHGSPRTLDDFGAHDFILFDNLSGPGALTFRSGGAEVPVHVRARLRVNTAEAAIDAALAGVGMARVLSYQVADAVRSGKLVVLLEAFEPDPWPINLVYPGQRLVPQKLWAFLDFAAPRLNQRLREGILAAESG